MSKQEGGGGNFGNLSLYSILELSAGDSAVPAGLPPSAGRLPALGRPLTNTADTQTLTYNYHNLF